MIALTDEQRVSIAAGATALENLTFARYLPDEIHTRQIGYVATMRDILRTAEDAPREGAPIEDVPTPLWRDSDREDWMRDGSIHLELVAAPSVTAHSRPYTFLPGTYVAIETTDEMVAVSPEHLPALIAMLTEVQRRIEAGDAK